MKSFLQGRHIQKSGNLKSMSTEGAQALSRASQANHGSDVLIETVKEGEKVVRLIVTCSCGERIEIDCLYPPGQ